MMAPLSDEQKRRVAQWIGEGASLAEVQRRLADELGISLTYMDVKFLIGDLELTPENPPEEESASETNPRDSQDPGSHPLESETPKSAGGVSVSLDTIARPGAIVSGKVNFPDGESASWQLDQLGRLGMIPSTEGYRPSQTDLAEFQLALEQELRKQGL